MMIDLQDPSVQEMLLGRPVRKLLTAADRQAFAGRRVLITGAGGTIGAELARQIAGCRPGRLVLFEQSEYHLFKIETELAERFPQVAIEPVLGDVTRLQSLRLACESARPDVIYHAAAYKHVTMAERAACATVRTNVFGTLNVLRAARQARVVVISTDKAAQPRSVMGASKRLAELVAMARGGPARPLIVRFGNILGSSGSFLEIAFERIAARKPLVLTHPGATRYFMTASEAVSLVMKTDLLGHGGEIYWLDMGRPVRVLDLAHRALAIGRANGYPPQPIKIIGLRPGEKLQEELTSQGVEMRRTKHARIWAARQAEVDVSRIHRIIRALTDDLRRSDALGVLEDLCAGVPEFRASAAAWETAAASTVNAFAQTPVAAQHIA